MNKDTDQYSALFAHLSRKIAESFLQEVLPELLTEWHVPALPYYATLEALADHCGDCSQCFADGDGETTCEEALVLELATKYEIDRQLIESLSN